MGIILVDRGVVLLLAREFNCSNQTVRNALKEVTWSELTERIRLRALETDMGGVERKKKRVFKL
jgi:hypothetical protein